MKKTATTSLMMMLLSVPVFGQSEEYLAKKLADHVESFAGEDHRAYVSGTLVQPFVSYITTTKTTFGLNLESTYDWRGAQWSVPINFTVSQLLKVGNQPFQIGDGVRHWAETSRNGPEGWGARLQLTFLFPK